MENVAEAYNGTGGNNSIFMANDIYTISATNNLE
jgi:hypothetical protein